ncbi:MAG: T9SS type A sorting domain-containing protein [Muribaculaceae bacterium]
MKTLLPLIMLLACFVTARAAVNETLSVHLKDGTSTQFLLNEEPKITFGTTTVKVQSSHLTMEFEKANVLKFTYGGSSSVDEIKTESTPFIQQGNKLLFLNLANDCVVTIYNVNGAIVQSPVVVSDNQFEISVADLSAGIYIVKVGSQSYKIITR